MGDMHGWLVLSGRSVSAATGALAVCRRVAVPLRAVAKGGAAVTTLRALTWNVWGGPGWFERSVHVRATVRACRPDLVLLQELAVVTEPSGGLLATLASDLSGHYVATPGGSDARLHRGLAVLSRWPIGRSFAFPLPQLEGDTVASWALLTELNWPGPQLVAMTAHLRWGRENSILREAQMRVILDAVRQFAPSAAVLWGGDFNAPPEAPEMLALRQAGFTDAWLRAGNGCGATCWGDVPGWSLPAVTPTRLDYLMARPSGATNVRWKQARVLCSAKDPQRPSDHGALLATLELSKSSRIAAAAAVTTSVSGAAASIRLTG